MLTKTRNMYNWIAWPLGGYYDRLHECTKGIESQFILTRDFRDFSNTLEKQLIERTGAELRSKLNLEMQKLHGRLGAPLIALRIPESAVLPEGSFIKSLQNKTNKCLIQNNSQ